MPIHLRPISRRKFLFQSLVGAGGLILGPSLQAAGKPLNKHCFALFSDTHIPADGNLIVRGTNMHANLQRAVADLLSLPERPAGLFIAGDCAYSTGQPGDYAALASLIQPLQEVGVPIHIALGNHDDRKNFRALPGVVAADAEPVAEKHACLVKASRVNWYVLDSLEKVNVTPGLLGHEQLDWLANSLDANRRKPALVIVHHNPGISGNLGLKDTVGLFEVIRPRKQVKAYIFGHTHSWGLERDNSGIHLVNLPPVAYAFKQGDPSGWVWAEVYRRGMRLELRCLDTSRKEHLAEVDLEWREA